MKKLTTQKKIDMLRDLVQYNEETKRWYLNTADEFESLRHLVFESDIEMDNYHYEWLGEVIDNMLYDLDEDTLNITEIEEFEFDNIEPDVYTSELTDWLASKNERVYYLGVAVSELGATDGFNILSSAQYLEKSEIYEIAKDLIIKFLND